MSSNAEEMAGRIRRFPCGLLRAAEDGPERGTRHALLSRWGIASLLTASLLPAIAAAAEDDKTLAREAQQALERACRFFRDEVATEGGYLWRYSSDLRVREGEGQADENTVWVQPPGTPAVGRGLLEAYRQLQEPLLLEMARQAGRCLVRGQLRSGGWDYRIDFDPARRTRSAYRVDAPREGARNTTTLDDDTTQSALRLLMELDKELEFRDEEIHRAAAAGLAALVAAQYPNGAWPQRFESPPRPEDFPVMRAAFPESWQREFPGDKYQSYYTFNDNALGDTIAVMFQAARIYGEEDYRQAALRGGDFILLARMPEPQPGWAQQYDVRMQPAWARKFEPPSITGGEAAGILKTLVLMFQESGDRKYLEPIPRALEYYRSSLLPDGRLARFYELRTNRPLYFTRDYQLTYDDGDLPTHYGFLIGNWIPSIERLYAEASRPIQAGPETERATGKRAGSAAGPSGSQRERARRAIAELDPRGAWVEQGSLKNPRDDGEAVREVIDCRTFLRNLEILSSYLAAARDDRR